MHTATGTNRVVLGRRPRGGAAAKGGSEEEEMTDVQGEEATGEGRDFVMTQTKTATTAATATETETEPEAGALATNDQSDPAKPREVIRVDHCGAGDRSRTQG